MKRKSKRKIQYKFNIYKTFIVGLMTLALIICASEVSFNSINTPDNIIKAFERRNSLTVQGTFNEEAKPNPQSSLEPIYRVGTDEKKVAITFDLNWADKEYLYEILNILDKHNVKATFFVMGRWLMYPDKENQDKLREVYKRGHEIGNHSYTHADFKNINREKMIKEIKDTEKVIQETVGITTMLFRFPSGHYNHDGVKVVESLGYKAIQWDADSIDWKQLGLEQEYSRVIKKVQPGSILLFHNNGKYTPENLERLIPKLQNEGYNFVPVGQLIYKDGFYIDSEGVQRIS